MTLTPNPIVSYVAPSRNQIIAVIWGVAQARGPYRSSIRSADRGRIATFQIGHPSANRATDTSDACSSPAPLRSSGWRAKAIPARSGRRGCWSISRLGSFRLHWPTRLRGSPGPCSPATSLTWRRSCDRRRQSAANAGSRRARVVRCDDEPVEPGMGKTRSVSSAQMRAKLIGTSFADFIRASGHQRRINRPDTWLHPNAQHQKPSCAKGAVHT
jgi:hypothetical protein